MQIKGEKFLKSPPHDVGPAPGGGLRSPGTAARWAGPRRSEPRPHCLCFFQNMAKVQVNNVVVLDNPSPFYNPFQFEITFECIEDLSEGECPPPPGCQLRLRTLKVSRARPREGGGARRGAAGCGLGSGGKLEVDGRRPPGRGRRSPWPGACRRATCSELAREEGAMLSALSAGGHSRDAHSLAPAAPAGRPAELAPRRERPSRSPRPRREGGEGRGASVVAPAS